MTNRIHIVRTVFCETRLIHLVCAETRILLYDPLGFLTIASIAIHTATRRLRFSIPREAVIEDIRRDFGLALVTPMTSRVGPIVQ
jgi:hypothetical protein